MASERRYILRSLFTPGSRRFNSLKSDQARLIYLALIANANDEGVVECDIESVTWMIPGLISRWSSLGQDTRKVVSSSIQALGKVELIKRFQRESRWFAEVNGFTQSQSGQVVKWEKEENHGFGNGNSKRALFLP